MQNRCLRSCLNVRLKHPVIDLHKDTGVDFLGVRYDLQLLLLLYINIMYENSHDPDELGLKFQQPNPVARITRSTGTGLLVYPTSIKRGYRRSPLYRGVDLWNQLNNSCRLAESREVFRSKAKVRVLELFELKMKQ